MVTGVPSRRHVTLSDTRSGELVAALAAELRALIGLGAAVGAELLHRQLLAALGTELAAIDLGAAVRTCELGSLGDVDVFGPVDGLGLLPHLLDLRRGLRPRHLFGDARRARQTLADVVVPAHGDTDPVATPAALLELVLHGHARFAHGGV